MDRLTYERLEKKVGVAKAFQVVYPDLPEFFLEYCWLGRLIEISNSLSEEHEANAIIAKRIGALEDISQYDIGDAYRGAKESLKPILLKKIGSLEKDFDFWAETYVSNLSSDISLRSVLANKIVSIKPSLEQWLKLMSKIGKQDYGNRLTHIPMFLSQILALPATCSDWFALHKSIPYWGINYELKDKLQYGCLGKIIGFAEELEKATEDQSGDWKRMFDLWEQVFRMSINFQKEKNQALDGMVKAARNVSPDHKFHCWIEIFGNLASYAERVNEPEKIRVEALEKIRKAAARPEDLAFQYELHEAESFQYRYGKLREIMLEKLKITPMVVSTVGSWVETAFARWGSHTAEVAEVVCQKFQEMWEREQSIPLSFKHLFQIAEGANRRNSSELMSLVAPRLIKSARGNIDKLGKILNLNNLPQAYQEEIGGIIREQI